MTEHSQTIIADLDFLTAEEKAEIDYEIKVIGRSQAAGVEALKLVQRNRGWISDEALCAIASYLRMSSAELEGVATFYNLIYRQPVGHYVIHVCDSIACHLTGYESVVDALKSELNIEFGQTSLDGCFTLLTNACLGGCDKAPVMMIAGEHYCHLTPESAIDVIQTLKAKHDQIKTSSEAQDGVTKP